MDKELLKYLYKVGNIRWEYMIDQHGKTITGLSLKPDLQKVVTVVEHACDDASKRILTFSMPLQTRSNTNLRGVLH